MSYKYKILCGILLIGMMLIGSSVAKYVYQSDTTSLQTAKSFYLESDLLQEDNAPRYTLKAGENDIEFAIMNYPDQLRISEVDIACEVILYKDEDIIKEEVIVLNKENQNKKIIKYEDCLEGEYHAVVRTEAPYSKVLTAYFTVVSENDDIQYTVNDKVGSPTLQVVVKTMDYQGSIKIKLPEGVYPDNTDGLMSQATGNVCEVNVSKHSSYTFQFFKQVPSRDYSQVVIVEK